MNQMLRYKGPGVEGWPVPAPPIPFPSTPPRSHRAGPSGAERCAERLAERPSGSSSRMRPHCSPPARQRVVSPGWLRWGAAQLGCPSWVVEHWSAAPGAAAIPKQCCPRVGTHCFVTRGLTKVVFFPCSSGQKGLNLPPGKQSLRDFRWL